MTGGKTCWQRGFRLFATKKNDVIEEVSSKLEFGSLLAYEQVVTKPSGWELLRIAKEIPWTLLFHKDGTQLS